MAYSNNDYDVLFKGVSAWSGRRHPRDPADATVASPTCREHHRSPVERRTGRAGKGASDLSATCAAVVTLKPPPLSHPAHDSCFKATSASRPAAPLILPGPNRPPFLI
eukprot:CAMPEP_0119472738 /NCGR_PEP_ID=MMETSP1344-20130328/4673_1 /TAXON_ID=236787 /ORGANISM="Florenciella parvula, Strain CCMP2471" /LENGTH=107 /DNA_ID=CAMNT_0007505727 /DNA_START=87 /DNA_END=411 /DNA_ORIENTATION=+